MKRLVGGTMVSAITLVLMAAAVGTAPQAARAQDEGEKAEAEPPPKYALEKATDDEKKLYAQIKARMLKLGAEQVTSLAARAGFGLDVGLQIAPMLETFVWGYHYSGDEAWLERFVVVMTALEKKLVEDPDGNLGWYTPAGRQKFGEPWPPKWPDAAQLTAWQQSEARVAAACAEFAMALADEPALKEKFGAKADAWIETIQTRLMPKWEKNCYIELSEDRAVFTWPARTFSRSDMTWQPYPGMPTDKDSITLPHVAISEIIQQYLKLWQLTDKAEYRTRAAKLLRWQKSCLRFLQKGSPDRRGRMRGPVDSTVYWWNYWDPSGDYDFLPEGGLAFGMYLSLEPGQYARDVAALVEGYHSGVVVDSADIERLVTTQTKIMRTGDTEKPTWKNQQGTGRGVLWPHLAEFDETLAALLEGALGSLPDDFGGPLRFMQEKPRWSPGERRRAGKAAVISWSKTFKDFQEEMTELIEAHPPPDPRTRFRNK